MTPTRYFGKKERVPLYARPFRQCRQFQSGDLQPGEKVRVIKWPLAGLEGELITMEGKSKMPSHPQLG
jgi:hypothetical protein